MGALLMFPSQCRDLTDEFQEWRQQTFRSLPAEMQQVIRAREATWSEQWHVNKTRPIEVFNTADRVHPNIWLGSASSAEDEKFLDRENIGVIVNMAIECKYLRSVPTVRVVRIGIDDGRLTNVGVFERAAEEIARAVDGDRQVLVHCAAGVSRSATAVAAYLMLYENFGWAQALVEIQKFRPCINPHPLLLRSLIRDLKGRFIP